MQVLMLLVCGMGKEGSGVCCASVDVVQVLMVVVCGMREDGSGVREDGRGGILTLFTASYSIYAM